jgi:sugar transferase (PEP-CTERM system associated)
MNILRYRLFRGVALLAATEATSFLVISYCVMQMFAVQAASGEIALMRSDWGFPCAFTFVTQAGVLSVGLYSPWLRTRALGLLLRAIAGAGGSALVLFPFMWAAHLVSSGPKLLFTLAVAAAGSAFLSRLLFLKILDRGAFQGRIMVFGSGNAAASLTNLRRRSDQRGFRIVGYVQPPGEALVVEASQVLRGGTLPDMARARNVTEIVVAMDERRAGFPAQELLECRQLGIGVLDLTTFLERETGKVHLNSLNPSWMIFGPGFRRDLLCLTTARTLDILASLGLLLFAWPVMLLTCLAIKLESGWSFPTIYRQKRVGLGNQVFELLKFRSMGLDAESAGQARWATKNDLRVTRVGAFIRMVRIDELPQIFNILRGDMRFVGPRPERPEFVDMLATRIAFYRERHCVKPGLTGWAQISYPYGSSEADARRKLEFDLYYVKHHNLLFDLLILLQTAEVVLWRKGAC